MNQVKSLKTGKLLSRLLACGALLAGSSVWASGNRGISVIVDAKHAEANGGITGGFTYDAANDVFWINTYGSAAGVRRYDVASDTSETYVQPTDLELLNCASDIENGEKLIGANIYDANNYVGTVTNSYGFFLFILDKELVYSERFVKINI